MKKILYLLSIAATMLWTACSGGAGNMQQMNEMKDSIFARYPEVAAVTLNVNNDNELLVAVGSEQLFAADETARVQMADELAAMANRIFGSNNKLRSGIMYVTPNEMNQDARPADAKSTAIPFANKH